MTRGNVVRKQKVYELIKRYIPSKGKVLDMSCGNGEVLDWLRQDGYSVRGTNYTKYPDACKSVDIDWEVDIYKGLPYRDCTYDCVILLDVIAHLSDHNAAIKEISRVIKPDGYIIVVTPNIMRINSRLHFLLTGFFKAKKTFIGFDVPCNESFEFHNYSPHLPVFLYQLHSHNLNYFLFDAVGYKIKSFLMWFLFASFIVPMTFCKTHVTEKLIRRSGASKLLFNILVSYKSLCGENWFIMARKSGEN